MHAGHVSNSLYTKSNIRDLTNFMVKEPREQTEVLQCNLRKTRYIYCLICVSSSRTKWHVFFRLAPLNFGKYMKYWHEWRKRLLFHIIFRNFDEMKPSISISASGSTMFILLTRVWISQIISYKLWRGKFPTGHS